MPRCHYWTADVTDSSSVSDACLTVLHKFDNLTIVVNHDFEGSTSILDVAFSVADSEQFL